MKSMRRFFSRMGRLLGRRGAEARIREEIAEHIALATAENERAGMSGVEARRQAMLKFGGVEAMREDYRDAGGLMVIENVMQDVRYAIRSLKRTPGLTAFVIFTLALGIGMVSGTFSMLDALIFRPYPVLRANEIVTVVGTTHDSNYEQFSYREYLDIRDKTKSYEGVVAAADMEAVGFSANAGETPRIKGGMRVSGNYFRVFGVEPSLGRSFRDDEDTVPGRDAVMVLGPAFWKHDFAGDPSVIGRKVRLNGAEFTVIGVAPETFTGMTVFGQPDFYMPLAMAKVFSTDLQKNFFEDRDDRELTVRGRLKPGVTVAQAKNEAAVVGQNFEKEYPKTNHGRGMAAATQFEMRTRDDEVEWRFSVIFVTLAVAVLLVACTNVAGMLLSRARARKREIAVRLAIGAGRLRLARLLMAESLILALLGGAGGVAIGYGICAYFQSIKNIVLMTDLPMMIPFQINTRVLVATVLISVVSAVICGLVPALQSSKTNLVEGLKAADVDMPGRKRLWGRSVLVVAQVAMSLMLLTASFLMVRGFQNTLLDGMEFSKDHLLMTTFDPRLVQYDKVQTKQFFRLLKERIRETPGVEAATLTQNVPMGRDDFDALTFVPDGFQMPRDRENFTSVMDTADEDYFATMRVPILRGRAFQATDTAESPRVAIVNEYFAHHYWPGQDALGKHFRIDRSDGVPVEIVGIAQTIKVRDTFDKDDDFIYLPMVQHPIARMALMVRSSGDPLQLVPAVKDVVRQMDPNMPMLGTMTYEDMYLNRAIRGPAVALKLVGAMGLVGLMMTVAGLYGLVAYNVSRRTREIGIRIALGAARGDVLRLIMGNGLMLVGIGTAIGITMGFGVEQMMNSMVFNAGGVDFVAYAVVVPLLFVVTMLAAFVPARKAARIEPTRALRYE
jgi:macrolide transport system ATP-binding/permease protein